MCEAQANVLVPYLLFHNGGCAEHYSVSTQSFTFFYWGFAFKPLKLYLELLLLRFRIGQISQANGIEFYLLNIICSVVSYSTSQLTLLLIVGIVAQGLGI